MIHRSERAIVLSLSLGWVFVYAGRTALYPILPVLQQEYGLSATQLGALLSTYWLFFVLSQFPAGALSDRFGPKWVLTVCYLLASLALLAMGTIARSFPGLVVALSVYGIGTGAYFPTEYPIFVRTLSRQTRGMARSLINAGASIGLALGFIIAGPVYAMSGSWRYSIVLLAVPMVLLNIVHAKLLPAFRPEPVAFVHLGQIVRKANVLKLFTVSFCSLYGFWMLVTWTPLFLQTERGIGIQDVGWITAIVAVAALPGGLFMGAVSDRFGRKRVSLLALPLAAASIWALGYTSTSAAIIIALVTYGIFGKMAWQAVEQSWMGDYIAINGPELSGSIAGVWSIPVLFSSVLTSLLTGWIKDVTGSLVPAYGVAAAIVMAGWLILMVIEEPAVVANKGVLTGPALK